MPVYNYEIANVDYDLELITVEITLEDGSLTEANISFRQVTTSDTDTVEQLGAAIDQVVQQYIFTSFPPPTAKPQALMSVPTQRSVSL